MGYCSWGDVKPACNSEEEGYENHRDTSGIGEKRRSGQVSGIFEQNVSKAQNNKSHSPSTLALSRSSDVDWQFWAEDELSNTESRQRLTTRRKRRRSISYRNRAANRSRSRAPNSSSSSSSSSIHASSPTVRKTRRHCRCRARSEKTREQFVNREIPSASIGEATCTANNVVVAKCEIPSTSGQKLTDACFKSPRTVLLSTNHYEQTDDTEQDVRQDKNTLSKKK
ncbi:uncharacterized protein LOC109853727 [Pseudomyrmex gracilis]|uniref:uncharacterized protein LOC109853727 n=1 Tax=Pseudomyrmex gracilis TaxID=219809 RepID=UPI000995BFC4|nr:uncharacterized protein LOC109853727 [Pseudomyrmex gracilis]